LYIAIICAPTNSDSARPMVRTSMAKTIAMPMPTSWKEAVVIAAAVFIVLFVFRSIASYRRLRAFSGPFWAAQTELWLAQKTFVGGLNITLQNITDKYGTLKLKILSLNC
jgi:hypothetical protein